MLYTGRRDYKMPNISLGVELRNALGGNRKPYARSLESWSDLPPELPVWVRLGHKMADLGLLAFIFCTIALKAFECIER